MKYVYDYFVGSVAELGSMITEGAKGGWEPDGPMVAYRWKKREYDVQVINFVQRIRMEAMADPFPGGSGKEE